MWEEASEARGGSLRLDMSFILVNNLNGVQRAEFLHRRS